MIEDGGEVLFVRRAFDRGRGGQWCLPGGTMWRGERPDVACVREAFEETGLRVTVRRPIAVFKDAHYFLCTLTTPRANIALREVECIDSQWITPDRILKLGSVMDLRRMIPLLGFAGLEPPSLPRGLKPAVPERLF